MLPATDRAPGVGGSDPAAEAALRRISAASRAENWIDGIRGYLVARAQAVRSRVRAAAGGGCHVEPRPRTEGWRSRRWWWVACQCCWCWCWYW